MNEEQYLKERIEYQMTWYNRKSKINKSLHLWTKSLVIVFSALIPFAAGFVEANKNLWYLNYVIGVLGMLVAILTGVSSLLKYQEKWVKYRTTSEALRHEKFLYLTGSGAYKDKKDPFHILVTRVENIITMENTMWSDIMNTDEE
ncbi:DUF4231 domain-containing protein [Aquimarina sp. D1M17]|uniref:DUF4231 domain-containing protein n=1 Tax=Aquimarina acroporae TaxID=2937283 RepID=UPI0020BE3291|nr:DUF4231 domain-containing protein [Aquimarina acroporae]MCK8520191.1 DUF4231 domain-containing protein [Aquimarina acroporae]